MLQSIVFLHVLKYVCNAKTMKLPHYSFLRAVDAAAHESELQ